MMVKSSCKTLSILLAGCLGVSYQAAAQPCHVIQLRDTMYTCANTTVQLNATITGTYQSFRWIPTQGLSDTTILNPIATLGATPVTYTLIVQAADTSILFNGDFARGNTGFTAPGHTLNCSQGSSPGDYCILNNISTKHPSYNLVDHTTGTGQMMYIDALPTVPQPVWRQTVPVIPNRDYLCEVWVNNIHTPQPPLPPTPNPNDSNVVALTINNVMLPGSRAVARGRGVWVPSRTIWNSGPSASVIFEVTNLNPTHGGNDYVIDDVSMRAICIDTASVYIGITPPPVVDLGGDISLCADSVVLGSSTSYVRPSYLWNTSAVTGTVTVKQSGLYWLEVTDIGCPPVSDTIRVNLQAALAVDLGPDTVICHNDLPYILLSQQPTGSRFLWSNGYSDTSMAVTRSGTYWLQVSLNGCPGSDSIDIEVIRRPDVFIGGYQVICASVPETIGMEVPGATYLWNTGSVSPYTTVNQTGEYWLEVNVKGCTGRDTAFIDAMPDPEVDLGDNGYICTDEEIFLNAGNAGSRHYWNTGDTAGSLSVRTAGLYSVTVISPDSCIGRDSIRLTYLPDPVVRLGPDTLVCEETPLLLRPSHLNADSLLWSEGITGDVLSVRYGGEYIVTAVNQCGSERDTIHVRQIFCDIWVPNAFTPNGDGVNDVFRILGNVGRAESFGFSVYNRWGQRLFHTSDRYEGWDGWHNGGLALLGTYVYVLEYTLEGKPVLQKGSFHLIR